MLNRNSIWNYRFSIFLFRKVIPLVARPMDHGPARRYVRVMNAAISTPCIQVCAIDAATSRCAGCGRTLKEIGSWTRLSEDERKAIMALLPSRMADGAKAAS
jgi:predicted Fe-S protein YdhL (DUF1289 family)